MALTDDYIAFSKAGEDRLIDKIPLREVDAIQQSDMHQQNLKRRWANNGPRASFSSSPNALGAGKQRRSSLTDGALIPEALGRGNSDAETPVVIIQTSEDGYNSGRAYFLRAENDQVSTECLLRLKAAVKQANKRELEERSYLTTQIVRFRKNLKRRFESSASQSFLATVIIINFVGNIMAAVSSHASCNKPSCTV